MVNIEIVNTVCAMAHENEVIFYCNNLSLEELEDAYCDLKKR